MTSFTNLLELMGYTVRPRNSQRDYFSHLPWKTSGSHGRAWWCGWSCTDQSTAHTTQSWTSSQHWADGLPSTIDGSFVNVCVLVCACWNQGMLTSSVKIKDTKSPLLSNHYKQWNQSFSINTCYVIHSSAVRITSCRLHKYFGQYCCYATAYPDTSDVSWMLHPFQV